MARRTPYIVGLTAVFLVAACLLPATPQPLDYHDFADHRALFGVANFPDVTSNLGFLLVALAGLAVVFRPRTAFAAPSERWPYAIFFLGMLLTAAGSAYCHLAPDNARLFWDRLPMTVAFMALVSAQIVDRIDTRVGRVLLLPMLLVGAASVVYWRATEEAGAGNVVPYGMLQAYSVMILLVIAVLQPSRYSCGTDIYWVFAAYVLAKLFELLDKSLLALGQLVSGHTLKHVAAAVGGYLCRMLLRRHILAEEEPATIAI